MTDVGLERSAARGIERQRGDEHAARVSQAMARVQFEMARHEQRSRDESGGLGRLLAGFLDDLLK